MTQTLTRDQLRAQHALRRVQSVPKKFQSEYLSYANSLPANIVMNGLGQAFAMLLAQAKGESAEKDAHRLLYDHLHNWLCQGEQAVYPDQADLVEAVIGSGQRLYIRAQAEALAYLEWLKKFAQAYLAVEEVHYGETE